MRSDKGGNPEEIPYNAYEEDLIARYPVEKLIVVDDDSSVCKTLCQMCEAIGYSCIGVTTVDQARKLLSKPEASMVLIDINLGSSSGFMLLREFAHRTFDLGKIMISGSYSPEFPVQALRYGAHGYLFKPIKLDNLRMELNRVASRRALEMDNRQIRANLQEELEERTRDFLRQHGINLSIQHSLAKALCRLAEFRDPDTGAHLDRMAAYCYEIAKKLNKLDQYKEVADERFCHQIQSAAPLHDIGKAAIPDNILMKPGKLTDKEFDVMKTHTVIGRRILENIINEVGEPDSLGLIKIGIEICATHHEHWDGNGYPARISGENIPLAGRIAAIADFYDALTSARVYRTEAMTHQQVASMIRQRSGTQFDPDLVEVFFNIEDQILHVHESFEHAPYLYHSERGIEHLIQWISERHFNLGNTASA